ncbi:MAG: hypothetical protein JO057_21665, partial [Chloroflexi bacterium]|nr:hypothetical protein [Chloroflexota bacterium]
NQNWRTAGELTSSILATVAAQGGSGELAVLVAPDDLNGAFVYRNGLPEALALFGPRPGPAVDVLAGAFLQRPDETITFTPVGPGSFAFGIPSARGSLVPSKTAVAPGVTLTPVDLYHVDVTLDRPLRVAYFSDGEMHIVDLTTS